jgi:hypothetical protein
MMWAQKGIMSLDADLSKHGIGVTDDSLFLPTFLYFIIYNCGENEVSNTIP